MKHYIYLCTIALILFSCSTDNDTVIIERQGTVESLKAWANPEIIDALENLGLTIYEGDSPPNIEGNYQMNERVLEATNVPNDNPIGFRVAILNMSFNNQNNSTFTINFNGSNIRNDDNSLISTVVVDNYLENSFITGSGNFFTAFFKVISTRESGTEALSIYTISGELREDGISGIRNGLFMLDNYGQSGYIENNTGRIFKDNDGMADRLE